MGTPPVPPADRISGVPAGEYAEAKGPGGPRDTREARFGKARPDQRPRLGTAGVQHTGAWLRHGGFLGPLLKAVQTGGCRNKHGSPLQ